MAIFLNFMKLWLFKKKLTLQNEYLPNPYLNQIKIYFCWKKKQKYVPYVSTWHERGMLASLEKYTESDKCN